MLISRIGARSWKTNKILCGVDTCSTVLTTGPWGSDADLRAADPGGEASPPALRSVVFTGAAALADLEIGRLALSGSAPQPGNNPASGNRLANSDDPVTISNG